MVIKLQPVLAPKITGMLLDRLNHAGGIEELLLYIENPNALAEKVSEALDVLEQHAMDAHEGKDVEGIVDPSEQVL